MKKSAVVFNSLLSGGLLMAFLHHSPVYRDQYASREDCLADWQNTPNACQEDSSSSSSSGGSGSSAKRYYGPSYEEGSRPRTTQSYQVQSRQMVSRSGFGSSGARFSGGG
ncbi:hypothetical protein [Pseudomonas panipatensis]|jgi:hypothetical protein|uniref:DUF1190 domain-containing protein n=1 Tax=Pseudomonas panipatensis TaxID=428992 RepID=A0A1G8BPR0_9PSED|nr:hypothetical protein [Pseudomonas panipatensis]SDH35141.1 hypothetical protein SAMN05216272_101167 [Pseudomonas panipatensis]SMP71574.1 hypothetical protein SAMN06295951_110148 [Pseudomonas panipatensis]